MPTTDLHAYVTALTCDDAEERLQATRRLRNVTIGNPTYKAALVSAAVPALVTIVNTELSLTFSDDEMSTNRELSASLLVQAMSTLGSFAHGSEDDIRVVVEGNTVPALISALQHSTVGVVEAAMRTLKIVYTSKKVSREYLFRGGDVTCRRLIELLGAGDSVAENAALVLGRCGETEEQLESVAAAGGVHQLVLLLTNPQRRALAVEASLEALAILSGRNERLGQLVGTVLCGGDSLCAVGGTLQRLLSDPRPRVRLFACTIVCNVASVEPTVATFGTQRPLAFILPVLIKLLSEPLNIAVRVEAPRVLARLIEKDPSLQKDAGDSEAVNRLIDYLTDTNNMAGALPSSQQLAQLHESALMALSGLCATSESTRSLVVGAGAMPHIARGLEHTSKVVRVAACHCIRVLARSVKLVRTALVDCAISRPLFHLLQDDALDVVASASATICNVLLDHSPIKEAALCEGGLARLAALATSMDSTVRLNCIWALKNFSYQAKLADKAKVLQVMEWERLYELLTDESVMIREQALGLVRNLVCGGEDHVEQLLTCGPANGLYLILQHIEARCFAADVPSSYTVMGLYTVCNIASGGASHKEAIMSRHLLLQHLLDSLGVDHLATRCAAVWCFVNLTWPGEPGCEDCTRQLRSIRLQEELERVSTLCRQDEFLDRAKMVLDQLAV